VLALSGHQPKIPVGRIGGNRWRQDGSAKADNCGQDGQPVLRAIEAPCRHS
jgi:hypothetical protein